MDERREIVALLRRGGGDAAALEDVGDGAVERRGGELDGVARHDARVERVEPARAPIVPRAVLDDAMIVDAVAPRLGEGAVSHLVHAGPARGRPGALEPVP